MPGKFDTVLPSILRFRRMYLNIKVSDFNVE